MTIKYPLLRGSTTLILIFFTVMFAKGQFHEGYIYGKITTNEDKIYIGLIRWGKEEVFWTDMFNANKINDDFVNYLTYDDINNPDEDRSLKFTEWLDKVKDDYDIKEKKHVFACRFGDIKSLRITGKDKIQLELKNGVIYNLKGGSNDVGTEIRILDEKIGFLKLEWDEVDRVEFMDTPPLLPETFGTPLFGTVETSYGNFTGFIQWDHDERLGTDHLDGKTDSGQVYIRFCDITSIYKEGDGCKVITNDGGGTRLYGSNDVNERNKGIIVTIDGLGAADIRWKAFNGVTFEKEAPSSGPPYNSFTNPEHLSGTVQKVNDTSCSGMIVFNLDKSWDIEFLQGNDKDIDYQIPFKNISTITPKNYSYSDIELKNGLTLLIGEMQDVSASNNGLLIFENKDEAIYVSWELIRNIALK